VQPPIEQSGEGCAHAGWFCHEPVESQLWGVVPEHCIVPGAQLPVHSPTLPPPVPPVPLSPVPLSPVTVPVQRNGHVVVVIHVPVVSHVWIDAPSHWVSPGTHEPSHIPAAQPNGHAWDGCQAPASSQSWTPSPAHCFVPIVQAPAHCPSAVH
jgi:hypothetical protein